MTTDWDHPRKAEAMNFVGSGEIMSEGQVAFVAQQIGVAYAQLRCIIDVETNGTGFDSHKRPKMLFEPLHFYRNLPARLREMAVSKGLASPTRPKRYPRESYTILQSAIDFLFQQDLPIDDALLSCSWGMGQVMGDNHAMCGYATVTDLVEECMSGEVGQLRVMVGYLKADGLLPAMRVNDWGRVERGYNGTGAHGVYAAKLARDYAKIKDQHPEPEETNAHETPPPARIVPKPIPVVVDKPLDPPQDGPEKAADGYQTAPVPTSPPQPPVTGHAALPAGVSLPAYIIKAAQEKLRALGYFGVGAPNGLAGSWTAGAITSFQVDNGLPKSGEFDDDTLTALDTAPPRPISPDRLNATIKSLRKDGSIIVQKGDAAKNWLLFQAGGGGIIAAISTFSDWFGPSWHKLDDVRSIFTSVPSWAWAIVAVFTAAVSYYFVHQAQQARVDAEKIGMFTAVPGANVPVVPASLPATTELVRAPGASPKPAGQGAS